MSAETLNCPMCGAATSTDQPQCQYCRSRLATIACASCFGMMFIGSRHCPRCGAPAAARADGTLPARSCPKCRTEMKSIVIGSEEVRECAKCLGLWIDVEAFEKICANREQQAVVLGIASPAPTRFVNETTKVTYAPCPECQHLMNRINFARCSGVIVDVCKGHGTWFDRDELSRIIEFIRGGGLEVTRAKEKADIEEEHRRLRAEQVALDRRRSGIRGRETSEDNRILGIASARGLLKLLLD